jgi:hypothetical protein
MRVVMWSVTLFAVATTVDTHWYDGRYMQVVVRFATNIFRHMW